MNNDQEREIENRWARFRYERDRLKILARRRELYRLNRERVIARRQANKESAARSKRRYREANREKYAAWARAAYHRRKEGAHGE